jgi:hypothetical protein
MQLRDSMISSYVSLWYIWRQRNKRSFKGSYRDSNLSLLGQFYIGCHKMGVDHQIYMISLILCLCNLTKGTFGYITSIHH